MPANTLTSMKPASSLPHWPVSLLLALQIWAQPTQPHFGMDCGPSSWRSETSRSCQIPQGKAPGKNTPAPSTNQYFDSGVGQGDCSTPRSEERRVGKESRSRWRRDLVTVIEEASTK